MKMVFLFGFLVPLFASAQPDTVQKIISGRRNQPQQQQKPYVILISADGFRYDYAEKHGATFLQSMGKQHVKAEHMIPSYPSLTFPNHYSLVTGMYPAHHGLVDNHFYDPQLNQSYSMSNGSKVKNPVWYGGLPLWVLAEQQGMLSASFYWVGSEAPIAGASPTYYYHYNEAIPIQKRIQAVVDWLRLPEESRPHLITFYLPEIDHAGHDYGPDAAETAQAVKFVDSALQQLTEAVAATSLPVNYIFTADHGMTKVDQQNPVLLPDIDSTVAKLVWGGELAHIYVRDKAQLAALYTKLAAEAKGYCVYLKNETPKRWHYGADDAYNRIGDILLVPEWPRVFSRPGRKVKPGAHGFDPYCVTDMRTVFYAWGPAFKSKQAIEPFQNVDVFPVITEILGLKYRRDIDGKKRLAKRILQK
jgi:predicted AlkP superfamily pyrophosphatase or phosphodiesterase